MLRFLMPLRLQARLGGASIFRASGLLLGVWGASYFLSSTSRTLHLDSNPRNRQRQLLAPPERQSATLDDLAAQKAIQHFAKPQYSEDDGRLHEHEQTVQCNTGTGILRYDVVQIAT